MIKVAIIMQEVRLPVISQWTSAVEGLDGGTFP